MSCVCGEKGTETFENGDALGHSWGSWQSNGDDTHTRTCQICAVKETENCIGGTATCVNKAICSVCNAEHGAVDPANHANLVKTEAKAATHLTEGNIEYWHCDGCDKYFRDQAATEEIADLSEIVIPKLAEHTPDNTGWHSDDNNHWNTCACGAKLNEAAHTFEWVIDKQPTETEAGSKHEECTVCGYAKAAVEIPATGTTTPSTSPAPTSSPDATTTPAPTASPDATTTPAPTGTPGATATPAPTAEPETGTGPKTGDSTNAAPWAALLLTAGAALTGTALYSRKRKQNG